MSPDCGYLFLSKTSDVKDEMKDVRLMVVGHWKLEGKNRKTKDSISQILDNWENMKTLDY